MQISVNFVRTVLVVEALMQREGLEFTAEDLLHVYCVVKPTKNPETQMLEGFNSRFWRRSDRCSAAISAGRPVLPPLQVRGQSPRPRSSLSNEVSDLFEGISAELRRLLEEAEGKSSNSSESSSFSWDVNLGDEDLDEEVEIEDGEEVNHSDSDVVIIEPREVVEHSYSRSGSSSLVLKERTMAPKVRVLGKGQAPRTEPARLPEVPDSSVPVPAEDQSIAPSSMAGGKRKGNSHRGNLRQKRGKGAGSATSTPSYGPPNLPLLNSKTCYLYRYV
ncbi:hypothetical protein Acr_16g0001210 [Actinidia rufa]|uniref:Uncharacterized protein n=1 Tax=Actinidia rufa TaxID=165716 RepID=A0A7J0FYF5_9ERIC|nr:hypothetical protein Acr_16g0001210 [Actinidia rufa]